jgi:hypothetical protein
MDDSYKVTKVVVLRVGEFVQHDVRDIHAI